jgi:hypothetical protein
MLKNAIHPDDWHRLVGDNPTLFLVEIVGRALFIYLLLLLAIRLMARVRPQSGQVRCAHLRPA